MFSYCYWSYYCCYCYCYLDYLTCCMNMTCSRLCVRQFCNLYGASCTFPRQPVCTDYARMVWTHNQTGCNTRDSAQQETLAELAQRIVSGYCTQTGVNVCDWMQGWGAFPEGERGVSMRERGGLSLTDRGGFSWGREGGFSSCMGLFVTGWRGFVAEGELCCKMRGDNVAGVEFCAEGGS